MTEIVIVGLAGFVFLVFCGIFLLVGLLIILFLAAVDLPVGHEDEHGFRYGEPDDDGR